MPISYPKAMPEAIQNAFKKHNTQPLEEHEKPLFVTDVAIVQNTVDEFIASMPSTTQINVIHFAAVKACADKRVTDIYDTLGCGFDCASKGEAKPLLDRGVDPARISLGNCNIPSNELEWGIEAGIRYYAVDSFTQVNRMIEAVNRIAKRTNSDSATILANLKPFCRLVSSDKGSAKPFSTKFGVDPNMAVNIIKEAHALGLDFVGLSGHPGTQNLAEDAFAQFAQLFRGVFDCVKNEVGITMFLANIGGGWPGVSTKLAPSFIDYNNCTMQAFSSVFADWPAKSGDADNEKTKRNERLTIMTEPGRAFVSKAGWLQTHVINISQHTSGSGVWRVSLSAGKHHGLNEANKISFEWHTGIPSKDTKSCVLYGLTCDSSDIILGHDADLQEKTVDLPWALDAGDKVWVRGPAAYGDGYSTSFNSILPPKSLYIDSRVAETRTVLNTDSYFWVLLSRIQKLLTYV
ncbi:hypothetical protein FANTH_4009 [Fusarium anthophilum]|uniref:Orn/DAP/Arg decarboxylase 2 N-terminal domain-containing protein n=1 Tax=Fusarium anthophilum TaxID=48485 RepID=A0A8H5E8B8_9HYPO|nr:hypothetical protein FANTH_4009 [Fusarium anthophilum]